MSQDWDTFMGSLCVCQVAAPCGRILICENAWGVPLLGKKLWLINCLSWIRINHFSFGQVWYHYYALICIVSLEDDAMKSSLSLAIFFLSFSFITIYTYQIEVPFPLNSFLHMGNTLTKIYLGYFWLFCGALPTFNANNINIMITHCQTWRQLYILRAPLPLNVMAVFLAFFSVLVDGAENRRAKSNFLHDINFF